MFDLIIDFINPNGELETWRYRGIKTIDAACRIAEQISDIPDVTDVSYSVLHVEPNKH